MRLYPLFLLAFALPLRPFAQEPTEESSPIERAAAEPIAEEDEESGFLEPEQHLTSAKSADEPEPRWYFTLKPGYYYFTDATMRELYNTGGFTIRGEAGCQVWGPLIVWMDGGYFQKDGQVIGGDAKHKIMLGTLTLGLKGIYYVHKSTALYGGAGPRLFIGVIHNGSPFIRGVDTAVGIGGGFNAGVWVFPFHSCKNAARNIYLDFFADYSLKTLKVDEDEASSEDFDVDVSGVTAGLGIGIRF